MSRYSSDDDYGNPIVIGAPRGRHRDDSYGNQIVVGAPRSRYDDDGYGNQIVVAPRSRHGSSDRHRGGEKIYVSGDLLSIPGDVGHHRSSSPSRQSQPQIVNVVQVPSRSPSRSNSRERHRHSRRSEVMDKDLILKL